MAIIQLGELVSNIKGSIAGTTYQKNGAGLIMRRRSNPARTSTTAQQTVHQTHQRRLSEWQNLSLSDRISWNQFAALYPKQNKFGVSKKITGQNFFESVNTTLEMIGQPLITVPPAHYLPEAVSPFTVLLVGNTLRLFFSVDQDLTLNSLLLWATPITTRTTLSVNQQRKLIGVVSGSVISNLNLDSYYQSVFPSDYAMLPIISNKQVIFCLQTVNNTSGIASPLLCSFAQINPTPDSDDSSYYYYY
jgi:hypothetical protein